MENVKTKAKEASPKIKNRRWKSTPISKLIPYPKNPRKITDKSVQAVADSIKNFGFNQAIAVDKDGVIVVGHTRYHAAKLLGMKSVPVVVLDDLSEDQIRKYRIADNKSGELNSWDYDLLVDELKVLENADELQVYFHEDLSDLIKSTMGSLEVLEVNADDIQTAEDADKEKVEEIATRKKEAQITFTCPHCFEQITMDKKHFEED